MGASAAAKALALLALQLAAHTPVSHAQCNVCEPTSDSGCDACAAGQHPQHNVPGAACVACEAWDSTACKMHTGDLLAAFEMQLTDADTAEECVQLVRAQLPDAFWGAAIGVTYSIDGSDDCYAEYGGVDDADPRNTATDYLDRRSCLFENIGPAEITFRDVTFSSTNTFAAEAGEEWAVGQVVEFFDKGSGGATDFCAAIGGIYVVKSITASDHVILDVYKGDASVAGNTDCQVTGTTNLITAGGEACEACPAGKEPGTTFLTVGSCVDCDPGKFSSATSVCYECMTGASWRTLQGVGVTLAAAEYGCGFCPPGSYKVDGLTVHTLPPWTCYQTATGITVDPVDEAACDAIGSLDQTGCEAVLTNADWDGDNTACTFSRTVNTPESSVQGSATCEETAGIGWGGTVEQLGDVDSFAACAEQVMLASPDANGVEYCPSPGEATNPATSEVLTCNPGSCFARKEMEGITGWKLHYRSCFLDKSCQKCEAGKTTVQTYEFVTGNGIGGTEVRLADQTNAAACAALVQATHPRANGVTFAGQLCFAEFSDAEFPMFMPSTSYYFAPFAHEVPSMANIFMPGDGEGDGTMVGRTASKEACIARVKELEPDAIGATYLQHPNIDGGITHQACFAEYEMTKIDTRWAASLYQTMFFVNTGCQDCPSGTVSIADGEACEDCDAGKEPSVQREVDGTTITTVASCDTCEAGKYAEDDHDQCTECAAGRFQSSSGKDACQMCTCGRYQPATGQISCITCPAGRFLPDSQGTTACIECEAGKYQEWGSGECSCSTCEPGKYQASTGQASCIDCSPGQYRESAISCSNCPVGQWSDTLAAVGVSDCIACVAGQYLPSDGGTAASLCIECAGGKYSVTPGSSAESSCIPCAAGKAMAATGSAMESDCADCAAGRYGPSTGQTDCISCPPGQSQATAAMSACVDCGVGQYQGLSGEEACRACESGKTQMAQGGTSCIDCPAGTYESGDRVCSDCPQGRFTVMAGDTVCIQCEPGFYQDTTGQTACTVCEVGQYAQLTDASNCEMCLAAQKPSTGIPTHCIDCNDPLDSTAADYNKVYASERDECACISSSSADSSAVAGETTGAYYDQRASWAAAVSKPVPEWSAPIKPLAVPGAVPRAAAEFVLPWQEYAPNGGWVAEDGWDAVDIVIDRSAVARWYHDRDSSDKLKESSAVLHNTYLLQCLVDGKQALLSRSAFATVLANSIKLPNDGGTASCVNCASARECVTCCNEKIFCPSDGSECIPLLDAGGLTDGADGSWEFADNCTANDTEAGIAIPKAGWWRSSADSPRLHQCPVMDACKGGHDTPCATELGYRHDGITCATCRNGYMRSSDGRCLECPSTAISAAVLGASILFAVLVGSFLIQKNARSCHLPTVDEVMASGVTSAEKITIAFRIMMAFIQLTRLTTSFVLPWPMPVKATAEAASVVTDPGVATRAVPCFFSSGGDDDDDGSLPFTMTKSILITLSPVFCILIPAAYYSLAKLRESRKKKSAATVEGDDTQSSYMDRTVAAIVCLIFVLYPTVVKQTFSMFTCVDLEAGYCSIEPAEYLTVSGCEDNSGVWTAGLSVLRSDAGVQCFDGDHGKYVWLLSVPSIVLWVIGIPLSAAITMKYYHDLPMGEDGESALYALRIQRKFAFLYKGFEPDYYYWEIIVLARKMWFVVIDVLGESLGPVNQTVLALIAVLIALLLHIRAEPYQVAEIDLLERLSLTASTFTLVAGLFYHGRVQYCEETHGLSHALCTDIHREGWSHVMTTLVFAIQVSVLLYFVRFIMSGAKETYQSKRGQAKEGSDNAVRPITPRTGQDNDGLPVPFVERHKMLQQTLQKIDDAHGEMGKVGERLPGFKADVDAVQLWLSRMRGSVDWKERQADAVVRRHEWEEAHPEHKTTAANTKKKSSGGKEQQVEEIDQPVIPPSPRASAYAVPAEEPQA